MRPMPSLLAALALASTPMLAQAESAATPEQMQATRAVTGELLKTLSGKLQESMKANGPAESISVCKTIAPQIALGLADKTGWKITRVGTRVRNVDMGTPNVWQHKALAHLNADLKSGAKPETLEWSEVVTENGMPTLHYAKAIVLQTQCLACHGTAAQLAPGVADKLKANYPHDQATGYAPGQLRGAVVISRPL
ncbi:Tll0287-like domain-containing protein [Thiomonas bhubaneswarensis]|uniref:Tll0287-like domain-containing protein n=1 Tax=Thiomonas bhubaneswarensis TaxID=339866 RepID=A0A0K6I4U4_9BURK|nr:DUF3365 domain-containing protein [Thiomonas bhubaneswarensis]CUA98140.1 Protein of unknown function (DUF3365) [Thiomonas bhubaneswarensis]